MTNVYSSADVRDMDRAAIESGISGLKLMDSAADALFNTLNRALGSVAELRVLLFCGVGNNGGDGYALAAKILAAGGDALCVNIGDRAKMTPDCAEMCRRYIEADGEIADFSPDVLSGANAVVDAMFGTGFRGNLTGDAASAAALINAFPGFRLAADIPSGLYSDYGGMCENAVAVDATVTFSFPKPSCLLLPSAANCGKLIVADIGIPAEIISNYTPAFAMTDEGCLNILPRRSRLAHKGKFGTALIIAGSSRYTGAPYLAAEAAVRTGAGRVTLAVPSAIHPAMSVKLTEAMPYRLPDSDFLGKASLYDIMSLVGASYAVLIGPGLGRNDATAGLVHDLASMLAQSVVFDADGINALAGHIDILPRMPKTPVLTPHDGEFARLFGEAAPAHGRARMLAVQNAAAKSGSVVLLKGHRSIIAAPDGRVAVNSTGNPGMAKGGTGDVLAGIIVSFLAQGIEPFGAACAAAWLHGSAGDNCAARIGEYGMTAGDMVDVLPRGLKGRNSIYYI
jgi:NAD(P)H-hydrate epimerase